VGEVNNDYLSGFKEEGIAGYWKGNIPQVCAPRRVLAELCHINYY